MQDVVQTSPCQGLTLRLEKLPMSERLCLLLALKSSPDSTSSSSLL